MNYQLASASVIGETHQKLYYNNQDAYEFYQDENSIIGIVADGCGSSHSSEVGARLGANFAVNYCKRITASDTFDADNFMKAIVNYLEGILLLQQTEEREEFIKNYFFFTLIGFVVTKESTFIFHSGDGCYILNDDEVVLDENNRPAYLAKALLGETVSMGIEGLPTSEVKRLLIATDGLLHLKEKLERNYAIGDLKNLKSLFESPEFFENPIALPKFLSELTNDRQILQDDTTVIMLQRK
jgi:hypothetical protein